MSDESILMSGSNTELIEPCPRCGDLFYHPKTLIECEKQRAEEWEEIAEKNLKLLHERDCHIEELEHKLEMAIEAFEEIEKFQVLTSQDIALPMEIARECLKELEGEE